MSMVLPILTFILLALLAELIFCVVRRDYLQNGQLNPLSRILEIAIFFVHGCASYVYLDSNYGTINTDHFAFPLALMLIGLGLVSVFFCMSRLGWSVSMGQEIPSLRTNGPYRHSRNPQIVSYFVVILGYSLLWPSWQGVIWIGSYMVVAHIMVRTEEEHLLNVYGEEYRTYCLATPRYWGFPRR